MRAGPVRCFRLLKFCLAAGVAGWLLDCSLVPACQQLPGENKVPDTRLNSDPLPDESKLPGHAAVAAALKQLPLESELPPAVQASGQNDDGAPDGVDVPVLPPQDDDLLADNNRPILKLQLGGPTAPIRALQFSADSRQIFAGGDDKVLHVWAQQENGRQGDFSWNWQQAVNWQIYRGLRGSVHAIAANESSIFFAGFGATAESGEVAMVDGRTLRLGRCLFDLEKGSKYGVGGLALTGKESLVAIDYSGRITGWKRDPATGQWQADLIRKGDSEIFDRDTSDLLERFRRFGTTLAASGIRANAGNETIIFARPRALKPDAATPEWDLVRRSLTTGAETVLAAPLPHLGTVPAIAVSSDGNRVASADLGDNGRLFVWDLNSNPVATTSLVGMAIRTISISSTGKYLMTGTVPDADGESQVVLWRWNPDGFQNLVTWRQPAAVVASCFSPDENWLAWAVNDAVIVKSLADLVKDHEPLASSRVLLKRVAFDASSDEGYRVLLQQAEGPQPGKSQIFNPQRASLEDQLPDSAVEWMAPNPAAGRWVLKQTATDNRSRVEWHVESDGQRQCSIPLDNNVDGMITSACWIADGDNPQRPGGIVVGTSTRNHIYLFRLPVQGLAQLVRQYRGHESAVTSVGISPDRRYLVSSANDSTVRFWKMDDAIAGPETDTTFHSWGAAFAVQANELVVTEVLADGPLYFRGVRAGDIIDTIRWRPVGGLEETSVDDPAAMLAELRADDFRRMLRFETRRDAAVRPHFYLYPAWQPLASLLVTADREWAWWSPYGYYDASFNGHRNFGWQINRGISRAPDFFRASEMKEELERPQLMKRLLTAGSMEDAFIAMRQSVPPNLEDRLTAENRLRPHIQIVRPLSQTSVEGNSTVVEAVVSLPAGIQPVLPKAFANGVPAPPATQTGKTVGGDSIEYHYQWQLPLPADRRLRIQVVATSQEGSADMAQVDVAHEAFAPPRSRKLFLIAAAVNQYGDSQIPQLEFALNNVAAVKQVLAANGQLLYELDSTVLLENSASRPMWSVAADDAVEQLRGSAGPDDLLVIFLSGHGISDPRSDQYYFVTASSRYLDLVGRQYGDCIALEDFSKFAGLPCRKLVILDTCESGSFRATGQQDLKPLVRALESDLFFTITASEGSADAYESRKDQLSFLTASLVAGMRGEADLAAFGGNDDQRVGFAELVSYVTSRVPAEIANIGGQQNPGAAPKDLFDFAEIPLTVRDANSGR